SMGALEFERGSRLPGASPLPEQGLILMAATTGQPVENKWWDRLIHKIRTRPLGPQEAMAVTGLMQQRHQGIKLDDKRLAEAFLALLERKPTPYLHVQFANFALTELGDEALADEHFAAAVKLAIDTDPAYPARIAQALLSDGRGRQATVVLQQMDRLGYPGSDEEAK